MLNIVIFYIYVSFIHIVFVMARLQVWRPMCVPEKTYTIMRQANMFSLLELYVYKI